MVLRAPDTDYTPFVILVTSLQLQWGVYLKGQLSCVTSHACYTREEALIGNPPLELSQVRLCHRTFYIIYCTHAAGDILSPRAWHDAYNAFSSVLLLLLLLLLTCVHMLLGSS